MTRITFLTPFWIATTACVLVVASIYMMVATFAWSAGLQWSAWFGVTMAVALLAHHVWTWRIDWLRRRRARSAQVADRLLGGPIVQDGGVAYVMQDRGWVQAMIERILPHTYHPVDTNETRSCLRIDVIVRLSAADRLRLLLCGELRVLATVYTDVVVREARTLANVEVHPFTFKE